MKYSISVIIPTTASALRAPLLWRALHSLQDNQDGLAVPIVVVNGSRYVPEALEYLKRRRDIHCLYLDEGNHCAARLAGRQAVETDFFAMLDDDDEYLPEAMQHQLSPLLRDPSIDVVITNGVQREHGRDAIVFTDFSTFQSDPAGHLMHDSWLRGGGALFRSARVPPHYLEVPRSMELTYMALKLALSRRLHFLNVPTFRWYRDTPESLSETRDYQQGEPEAIRRMLALNPPATIRRRLAQKYAASLHHLSNSERREGHYWAAWRYHLRSLAASPYGIRYLSYTRHLVGVVSRLVV